MEQHDYWNHVSKTKQFTTPFQFNEFSHLISMNAAILDVGCGYGRTLDELYRQGYHTLTGIDFSQGMIDRGHSLYPYLDLRLKTGAKIDFPDSSFDAVILFAVLTCIADCEEQETLISEIRRVLKPDGILYVNDFLLNSDERNLSRYQLYAHKYGTYGVFELPEGAVLRHHPEKYIRQLLNDFELITFEHLLFTTMNGHTSNGFYCFGKNKKS
ncbi:MAG: class I SAM-dependent methyltransferase [Lachnospiraceae bacterium]|nr:class I SAM-dependent methyltransferase [Lachnospiraceae bacterium]